MLGKIIRHKRENVEFFSLNGFKKVVLEDMFLKDDAKFDYDENNRGVRINGKRYTWTKLAEYLEWFDEAEIVTDKNENEKVMTWLNVD